MPEINLKDHYPDAHPQDYIIEVTQEVFDAMHEMIRHERSHLRQMHRYHAQHSLDNPDAQYEHDALYFLDDPCVTMEKK